MKVKIPQKAIIKKDDKYLILHRSPKAKVFPNYWDFPGGKLEPGEEPFDGIEREVMEETGIKIKAKKVLGKYEMEYKGDWLKFVVYQVDVLSELKIELSHEHTEYKWLTKDEILKLKIEPYISMYFDEEERSKK